jgi:hypothetical protein
MHINFLLAEQQAGANTAGYEENELGSVQGKGGIGKS